MTEGILKNPVVSGGLGTLVALIGMVGADSLDFFGRRALKDRIQGIKATHAKTIETLNANHAKVLETTARACNGQIKLGLAREAQQQETIQMLYDDFRRAVGVARREGNAEEVAELLEDPEARAIFERTEPLPAVAAPPPDWETE